MRTLPVPDGVTTKEARSLWKSVLTSYDIDAASVEILRVAVVSLDNFLRYSEVLSKTSPVFKTKSGQFKKNPVSELLKVERIGFLQAMRDLGLESDAEVKRPGRPTTHGI